MIILKLIPQRQKTTPEEVQPFVEYQFCRKTLRERESIFMIHIHDFNKPLTRLDACDDCLSQIVHILSTGEIKKIYETEP